MIFNMKTIKIDKNSKVIKFLTARSDLQPLFGIFPWRHEPYREGSLSKPLPEDTYSLRKALISHVVKTALVVCVDYIDQFYCNDVIVSADCNTS